MVNIKENAGVLSANRKTGTGIFVYAFNMMNIWNPFYLMNLLQCKNLSKGVQVMMDVAGVWTVNVLLPVLI